MRQQPYCFWFVRNRAAAAAALPLHSTSMRACNATVFYLCAFLQMQQQHYHCHVCQRQGAGYVYFVDHPSLMVCACVGLTDAIYYASQIFTSPSKNVCGY
eukprot:scaffold121332_cov21-Tisochrysis_lutea.AAC.3